MYCLTYEKNTRNFRENTFDVYTNVNTYKKAQSSEKYYTFVSRILYIQRIFKRNQTISQIQLFIHEYMYNNAFTN